MKAAPKTPRANPSSVDLGPISTNDPYRFADGITPREVEASGLVDNLQTWLDGTGGTLRSDTASGTDLPICFGIVSNDTGISWQYVYSGDTASSSRQPLLEVEYIASGVIRGTGQVGATVSARGTIGTNVATSATVTPDVSARGTTGANVSTSATITPAVSARGTVS